jgi:hypothetical protein
MGDSLILTYQVIGFTPFATDLPATLGSSDFQIEFPFFSPKQYLHIASCAGKRDYSEAYTADT